MESLVKQIDRTKLIRSMIKKGYSPATLSKTSGVHISTVYRCMRDYGVQYLTLYKLASTLDVNAEELLLDNKEG